jgi:hypothetical protein
MLANTLTWMLVLTVCFGKGTLSMVYSDYSSSIARMDNSNSKSQSPNKDHLQIMVFEVLYINVRLYTFSITFGITIRRYFCLYFAIRKVQSFHDNIVIVSLISKIEPWSSENIAEFIRPFNWAWRCSSRDSWLALSSIRFWVNILSIVLFLRNLLWNFSLFIIKLVFFFFNIWLNQLVTQ